MTSQIDQFFTLVESYAAATGLAEATISTRVLHDGKRIEMIRSGRDIGVRRIDEACRWFSAHWPEGADWPAGIPRPVTSPPVTEVAQEASP